MRSFSPFQSRLVVEPTGGRSRGSEPWGAPVNRFGQVSAFPGRSSSCSCLILARADYVGITTEAPALPCEASHTAER
ncbi:hypothetical protein PsorP6_001628 [Peronosclerospora sorghi]|uniref:Uncharacterized protein n=1 Tax=Peronosclerospora sorghi TaxID=230839 RepID=A0ACC0WST8_9STRA|nr:hypothetical protein PsorP6_001628 [Peronosclerospora sorghi]